MVFFTGLFENAKKNFKVDGKKKLQLQLPYVFNAEFKKLKGKSLDTAIKECGDNEVAFVNGDLVIGPDKIKSLFDETCSQTVKHVKRLLEKIIALEGVKYIVLVGGYGNSTFLEDACTKTFGDKRKVLMPLNAQTAIMEGAVLFGHKPKAISATGCHDDLVFDEENYDKSRKYV